MSTSLHGSPRRPLRAALIALLVLGGVAWSATPSAGAWPAAAHAIPPTPPSSRDTLVIIPGVPPDDFVISLEGGEGRAIPGEYEQLRIRIDRAGRGSFRLAPSDDARPATEGTFRVDDGLVRQLHRATARLWNPRPTAPRPEPGSVNRPALVLTGYGTTIRLGEPLRAPWDGDVRNASELMRRAVPDSLWARAGARSR